jgi:hypothetical protein
MGSSFSATGGHPGRRKEYFEDSQKKVPFQKTASGYF